MQVFHENEKCFTRVFHENKKCFARVFHENKKCFARVVAVKKRLTVFFKYNNICDIMIIRELTTY